MASYIWPPQGGGSGTVTSVGLSAPGSVFSVSGSPVTGSGTLSLTFTSQSANTVFAAPNGSPGTPSFRSLVAADIPTLGYVTAVTASSPLFSSGGTAPNLTIQVANGSQNGYLSSTDWNTFNNKQPLLTTGNLTDAGTDGITVTGGTGAVIGTGTSLSQHVADTTHNGYLSSTDWNTFNGKQAAGNYITALTGDVTASGPGSAAASLVATSNSTLTTLSVLSLPFSQTTGTVGIARGGTGQTSFAAGALSSNGTTLTSGTLSIGNGGTGQTSFGVGAILSNGSSLSAGLVSIANGGTGQGTKQAGFDALSPNATAGDIIYRNGPGADVALGIGSTGQVLTVVGGFPSWQPASTPAFTVPTQQIFTSSGTYTTPVSPAPLYVKVTVIGGGGGGGGQSTAALYASGGGGGGGTSILYASAATVGASQTVTVGGGGGGGASSGVNGTAGSTSSFGSLASSTGGGGGTAATAGTTTGGAGGVGGVGSSGTINIHGQDGGPGTAGVNTLSVGAGGSGGGTYLGGGGAGANGNALTGVNGNNGYQYGGGGGGGSGGSGGNGFAGYVLVEEFYQ